MTNSTMINSNPNNGQARTPRSILLNGAQPIDWTSWSIEHSGIYEAGTITITVPAPYADWPKWMQQTEVIIDVYAGFPRDPQHYTNADLTLLMSARIDNLKLDPATATLTLTGRDLTSLFTDRKTDGNFKNLTASQVITSLADQFPEVQKQIAATTTKVGVYYDEDKVQLQKQTTMWTLMTYLAQHEGKQCFVLGRTLYFGDFKNATLGKAISNQPYAIFFQPPTQDRPYPIANVEKLSFSHDMRLAGEVKVRVRSYHGAQNKVSTVTKSSPKTNQIVEQSAKPTQAPTVYDFTFPDLTDKACEEKAQQILNEISTHELKMDATAPGDTVLYPWTPVTVSGTNTIFDTTYQISKITRSFDTRGFTMTMSCRTEPSEKTVKLS